MESFEKDKKYILNTYKRLPIEIERLSGNYIYTKDGIKYLDFFSGISVNNIGYDKDVVDAIVSKTLKYTHISNYFVDEDRTELAKILVESSISEGKVFFTNSGAESTETALKLVKKWGKQKGKYKILTAYNSFHGRTTGALALTGQEKYQKDFTPLIPDVVNFIYNDIEDLEDKIDENVSAVFLEPVQGESGVIPLEVDFVQKLKDMQLKYGFLLVMDEIQTGLRRCGNMFAYQRYDIKPDVVILAKSLGGGLPLGAVIVSDELQHVLSPGDHGSTFGGNPVSCIAGLAVLKKLCDEEFINDMVDNAKYMMERLRAIQIKYPHSVNDVRGINMMIGVDVGEYAEYIRNEAMKKNLLINITNSTVIRLIPSLTVSKEEIDTCINILDDIIEQIE